MRDNSLSNPTITEIAIKPGMVYQLAKYLSSKCEFRIELKNGRVSSIITIAIASDKKDNTSDSVKNWLINILFDEPLTFLYPLL